MRTFALASLLFVPLAIGCGDDDKSDTADIGDDDDDCGTLRCGDDDDDDFTGLSYWAFDTEEDDLWGWYAPVHAPVVKQVDPMRTNPQP